MKTYLKLVTVLVVLAVFFTTPSAQADSHDGVKGNAKDMNAHANPRAGMGGTDGSAMPDMATGIVNARGMNPNANPRAALGTMNGDDKRAEARTRHEDRMVERLAEREAAQAIRKAEQEALRAAKPAAEDDIAEDMPVEPVIPEDIPA